MRERDINSKKFHKGHYEIIAKRFREALTPFVYVGAPEESEVDPNEDSPEVYRTLGARNALVSLAIDMATRFQADNEDFDPIIFLNRCSPDPENFPLSELWTEMKGN